MGDDIGGGWREETDLREAGEQNTRKDAECEVKARTVAH
jgi:hypothetical protein